jgi:lysozyme family protein
MSSFAAAFKKIIVIEGGYSDDAADHGGETRYGISQRSYPDLDIAALTLEAARTIYQRDFWDAFSLGSLTSQAIAEEVFDSHVNTGPRVAIWLQQAYNLTNYWQGNHDLQEDGDIGPLTIAAINTSPHPDRILKVLNGLQIGHYIQIVRKSPGQEKWFGGWLQRVWEH